MSYFGLSANQDAVETAQKKLADYKAIPVEDRVKAHKTFDDEKASFQYGGSLTGGVVTLTQAEAKYIDLNVRAYSDMGDYFCQFMPLAFGEQPVYKIRQDYPIRVNIGHLGGGPPAVKFQTNQSGVAVTPFQYFSEEFLVPNLVNVSFDLAKFKEKEQALERVAYQMKLARQQYIINTMLGQPLSTPLATALSTYYSSTPFNARTPYVLDPGVDANSIATTNIINATAEGGITKNMFRAISSQAILQKKSVKAIFIPISGKPWESWWNQASIVALASSQGNQNPVNAIPPSRWEDAVNMGFSENGQSINIFGNSFFLQPVNTMPANYFLVSTNDAPVLGWDQFSESVSDEDPLSGGQRGLSKRYEARSIALAEPDPGLLNFMVGRFA